LDFYSQVLKTETIQFVCWYATSLWQIILFLSQIQILCAYSLMLYTQRRSNKYQFIVVDLTSDQENKPMAMFIIVYLTHYKFVLYQNNVYILLHA